MNSKYFYFKNPLLALVLVAATLMGCPDDEPPPGEPSIPSNWTEDGVTYNSTRSIFWTINKEIDLYVNKDDVITERNVAIVLSGAPDGSTVNGVRVGTYTLGNGPNMINFSVGLNSNQVLKQSVSGKVTITSMDGYYLTGTFNCVLGGAGGTVLTGNLNKVFCD